MKIKIVIILTSTITFIGILYFWGVQFSSEDILYRKISSDKVKKIDCGFWKHAGNGHIGDIFNFDDPDRCRIVNDTLYFEDVPKAIVIKVIQRYIVGDYTMTLKRIPDGEECYYVTK